MKVTRKKFDEFAAMEELRRAEDKLEVIERYGADSFDIYAWEYISKSIELDELFVIKYMHKLHWFNVYHYQDFDEKFYEMLEEIREDIPHGEYSEDNFLQAVDSKIQELSDKIMDLAELKAKVATSL